MITLITYPAMGQSFSLSPFCAKAAMMLDFSGLAWRRDDTNDPRRMPHRKLPAIKTPQGAVIADSDGIRSYLEQQGTDFHPGLSPKEKALSRALIRMAEDHLYFHIVYDRWARDDVWPTVREIYFKDIPAVWRNAATRPIRKTVLRGLDAQGIARFSEIERQARAEQDLQAITDILWEGPFMCGQHLTLADMSVAPMLNAMRQTPVETPLALRVAGDPILMEYVERVEAAFLPTEPLRMIA